MDTNKKQQATQIIASKINEIPANTPMDYGTLGALNGMTKREGEATNMARYFVSKMENIKWSGHLYENMSEAERNACEIVKEIAAAAIVISGK